MKLTYKKSGVDIDRAARFVEEIKSLAKKTTRPEVMGGIGGFGALFRLPLQNYKKPVLVSSTDGVGTKLKVAQLCGRFEGLGIDLVGMNVNDIVTCGAEPLFFLDYFAVGKLKIPFMKEVIKGISAGCEEAGCALVGGETAEMPGVYRGGDFDLAGFTVGVVEEDKIIDGSKAAVGDSIIGVASNGFHSNGFSMVRKAFSPAFLREHAEEILKPTRIYVKPALEIARKFSLKAAAHITGGGFYDNIPRVLPPKTGALIHAGSWKVPTVFQWLQERAKVSFKEMYRTFNMGIGFMMVVPAAEKLKVLNMLAKHEMEAWVIGEIVRGEGVRIQ